MTPDEMRRAAALLRRYAVNLRGFPWGDKHAEAAEADDLARLLREEAEAKGWQPIETAPRGSSGNGGPRDTRHPDYVQPPKILLWTQEGLIVGYYDWYYHKGYGNGGQLGESAWRDIGGGQAYEPTHWRPLPPPPQGRETP